MMLSFLLSLKSKNKKIKTNHDHGTSSLAYLGPVCFQKNENSFQICINTKNICDEVLQPRRPLAKSILRSRECSALSVMNN